MAKKVSKKQPFNFYLLVAILVVVVAGVTGFVQMKKETAVPAASTSFTKLMTGMTLTVPETDFTVTINEKTGKTVEYGDINKDPYAGYGSVTVLPEYTIAVDNQHVVTILAINSGGSGEMFYLAVFAPEGRGFQMTDAVQLDDRIRMGTLSVANGQIEVKYLTHGPTQAMVDAPNTPVTRVFIYTKQHISEVKK